MAEYTCENAHAVRDFDGGSTDVPCGASATHRVTFSHTAWNEITEVTMLLCDTCLEELRLVDYITTIDAQEI